MNYRHQFHAGNFADVVKHVLLVQLVRALQKKEKGFLYLDTHAGRGRYDLEAAAAGDSLVRKPEWPDGIGRLWHRTDLPAPVAEYVALIRDFACRANAESPAGERASGLWPGGNTTGSTDEAMPRFYPGSPWLARLLARPQDRLAFCEQHPGECEALRTGLGRTPRASIHEMNGYVAIRAMLPPPERRGLVLVDPPFEAQDEFAQIARALGEGLRRFPSGVFALWYPLTERARVDDFFGLLRGVDAAPMLLAELAIAGEPSAIKMRGCGIVVVNPPWHFDRVVDAALCFLGDALAQAPGGGGRVAWIVRER